MTLKTSLLKICRIWRNHVTQVWTITIQLFAELLPVLSNKLPFFLPVDGAPELCFSSVPAKRLYDVYSCLAFKFTGNEKFSRI